MDSCGAMTRRWDEADCANGESDGDSRPHVGLIDHEPRVPKPISSCRSCSLAAGTLDG